MFREWGLSLPEPPAFLQSFEPLSRSMRARGRGSRTVGLGLGPGRAFAHAVPSG